jgi:hypothetical protein
MAITKREVDNSLRNNAVALFSEVLKAQDAQQFDTGSYGIEAADLNGKTRVVEVRFVVKSEDFNLDDAAEGYIAANEIKEKDKAAKAAEKAKKVAEAEAKKAKKEAEKAAKAGA